MSEGLIRSYNWTDTRDMCCDGFTKGKIDRTVLKQLMDGMWELNHPIHVFIEPRTQHVGVSVMD